jgi:hypothetical protein
MLEEKYLRKAVKIGMLTAIFTGIYSTLRFNVLKADLHKVTKATVFVDYRYMLEVKYLRKAVKICMLAAISTGTSK